MWCCTAPRGRGASLGLRMKRIAFVTVDVKVDVNDFSVVVVEVVAECRWVPTEPSRVEGVGKSLFLSPAKVVTDAMDSMTESVPDGSEGGTADVGAVLPPTPSEVELGVGSPAELSLSSEISDGGLRGFGGASGRANALFHEDEKNPLPGPG